MTNAKISDIISGNRKVVYADGFRRDGIVALLKARPLEVTFKKKDGTTRVMLCTLHPSYLPDTGISKEITPKENLTTVSAFDLNINAWRSFRVDSVEQIEDRDHKHAIIYVKREVEDNAGS